MQADGNPSSDFLTRTLLGGNNTIFLFFLDRKREKQEMFFFLFLFFRVFLFISPPTRMKSQKKTQAPKTARLVRTRQTNERGMPKPPRRPIRARGEREARVEGLRGRESARGCFLARGSLGRGWLTPSPAYDDDRQALPAARPDLASGILRAGGGASYFPSLLGLPGRDFLYSFARGEVGYARGGWICRVDRGTCGCIDSNIRTRSDIRQPRAGPVDTSLS